jgi:hypothetical protein
MNQFGDSTPAGSEFFFRVTDRLQMDSCLTAVAKEGKSLVLVSPSDDLLDHFGAAFVRRLKKELHETPVEVFMPPDSEVMLERFNKLLGSLSLDVATQWRSGQSPGSVWVVHDASALGTYEIELLTRLIHQFPGAGISVILMFASEDNPSTNICNQGKQFVSWVLEMPTPEQKLSAIQQARKNGNEEAAVKFFNRLSRATFNQPAKDAKKETPPAKAGTQAKPTATARPQAKQAATARKLWPWVTMVVTLLAISVGVAAALHPEPFNRFASEVNDFVEVLKNDGKVKPQAKAEAKVAPDLEKPEQNTGGPSTVKGEEPAPVAVEVATPIPNATATPAAPLVKEIPAPPAVPPPPPPKPEKVITELPEAAVQGRLWLKGLPADTYVLEHGTYASLKQARSAMKGKDWLVNARVVPVFADGKDEAEFAVLTGPFRSKERANTTIGRLNLSAKVKVVSTANAFKQASPP